VIFANTVSRNDGPDLPWVQLNIRTRLGFPLFVINVLAVEQKGISYPADTVLKVAMGLTNHSIQHSRLSTVWAPSRNHTVGGKVGSLTV
jgi:hypothetical protein